MFKKVDSLKMVENFATDRSHMRKSTEVDGKLTHVYDMPPPNYDEIINS